MELAIAKSANILLICLPIMIPRSLQQCAIIVDSKSDISPFNQ